MKYFLIGILILLSFSAAVIAGGEREQSHEIKIGTGYTFQSEILDETIQYFVTLPVRYESDPTQKFPIVYMFDGHMPNVTIIQSAAQDLWAYGPEMPEAIIVGILSNDRRRDYTPVATELNRNGDIDPSGWFKKAGGGPKYREFLRDEFFPHIEEHYETNGHRILIGHSLGGLFVLNDMLSKDRLFQSYISVDPSLWFAGNRILQQLEGLDDGSLDIAGNLYVSLALRGIDLNNPEIEAGDRGKRDRFDRLKELLATKTTDKLHVKYQTFPEEDHVSVAPASYRSGLRHVFNGYLAFQDTAPEKSKRAWEVRNYFGENPDQLESFFDSYSEKVGVVYPPDKRLIEFACKSALWKKQHENAEKLVELMIKHYPNIIDSWMLLGRYYETVENTAAAKEAYEKALSLDPENDWPKSKLERLSK